MRKTKVLKCLHALKDQTLQIIIIISHTIVNYYVHCIKSIWSKFESIHLLPEQKLPARILETGKKYEKVVELKVYRQIEIPA